MLNNNALIQRLLSEVRAFAGFSLDDAKDLLEHATRVDVLPGTPVVAEGDDSREFYIVMAGEFSVVKKLASGKDKIIAQLHPGDTFGEMSFLDGRPRAASVIAESKGLLLKFERNSLRYIPETAAKIYFNLASQMAGRIRDTNSLVSLALEGKATSGLPNIPAEALMTHRNFRNN